MGESIFQVGFDHEAHTQGYQVISEHEAYERYNDMLDECHEDVKNLRYELLHFTSFRRG